MRALNSVASLSRKRSGPCDAGDTIRLSSLPSRFPLPRLDAESLVVHRDARRDRLHRRFKIAVC